MPIQNPFKFSIVIITLNEEANIERCLRSIAGLTDDLVVVDSGSSDNTVLLCEQQGARTLVRPFDNYSSQRNFAGEQALYDWILTIDADEEINPELYQAIQQLKAPDQTMIFAVDRKTNFCGRWLAHSGLKHDRIERLYNRTVCRWSGDVHERLSPKAASCKILPGRLNHYTYNTYDDLLKANLNYSRIRSEEMLRINKKIRLHHIYISPAFRFFKHYFLNLGFLDGFEGYLLARGAAFSTYSKYARTKWFRSHRSTRT